MKNIVAGIDFGTTNSSAAISDGGIPRLVNVEKDKTTIPTALYFPDRNSNVYFGREAQEQYTNPETAGRFMRSIKRILGTDLMRSGTIINGKMVKFDYIIGLFIKHLKEKIEAAAGQQVDCVVMGRPVHFRDNDPEGDNRAQEELEKIAKSAGFKEVFFQFEPIAAAFAHEQHIKSDMLACVIDIGGGTSDFTIIRLSPTRKNNLDRSSDVLANTGIRTGGNDFDKSLSLKSFMPAFGMGTEYKTYKQNILLPTSPYFSLSTWSSVNEVYNHKTLNMIKGFTVWGLEPEKVKRLYEIIEQRLGHTNLDYVEKTKIQLSSTQSVKTTLDFLSDSPVIETDRKTFEDSIQKHLKDIEKSIYDCIQMANVKNTDIDLVILTGGSTETPCINDLAKKIFPDATVSAADKLSSVGLGLAYDSARRFSSYLINNNQHTK